MEARRGINGRGEETEERRGEEIISHFIVSAICFW